MFYLTSTFTDPDSMMSRHDALLRTLGAAMRAAVAAWVVLVVLRMAGVGAPLWLLPLTALAATVLAWRRMSARILPDGVTMLTGRALVGIVVALAFGSLGAWAAYELVLLGSLVQLSPQLPWLAAPLGGLSVYGGCRRVARRRFASQDAQDSDVGDFVVSVLGDLIEAVVDSGSSRKSSN